MSWCLSLSHIFNRNVLRFYHPPPPQAWYTVKPVFHGTHIRGRGWLKARERALLGLLDDFKRQLKLSKVKHTSQDLCLIFHSFCHATSVNFYATNDAKPWRMSKRNGGGQIRFPEVELCYFVFNLKTHVFCVSTPSPCWFLFRAQSHLAREAHARAFTILVSRFSSTLDSGVNAL